MSRVEVPSFHIRQTRHSAIGRSAFPHARALDYILHDMLPTAAASAFHATVRNIKLGRLAKAAFKASPSTAPQQVVGGSTRSLPTMSMPPALPVWSAGEYGQASRMARIVQGQVFSYPSRI